MKTVVRTRIIPALLLWWALVAPTAAHVFQTNMYPDIEFRDDALYVELWIASFLFEPLAGFDFGDDKPRPPEDGGELKGAITEYFAERCPMRFDGQVIPPELQWVKFEEMEDSTHLGEQLDYSMAKVLFKYPAAQEPRNIGVQWGIWFPDGDVKIESEDGEEVTHNPNILDNLIFVSGTEYAMYLTKEDPEFTWHAPPRVFMDSEPDPVIEPVSSMRLPLAPILIIGGLGMFLLFTLKSSLGAPARLGVSALAIAGAVAARAALPVDVPKFWETEDTLTEAEAKDLFEELHRGIYRAFEADSEDAIYNNLAKSVDGSMLDRLYEEVYQSLILRDDGGAMSRVSGVDYLTTEVTPANEGGGFKVSCNWQVHGTVRHWGHTHRRSNEYEADYALGRSGDRWKITSAVVNLQKRVPSPKL